MFLFFAKISILLFTLLHKIHPGAKKQTLIILICNNNNSLDLPVSVSYVFILNRIQQKERQIDGKTEKRET
jgi:hypothetical protein